MNTCIAALNLGDLARRQLRDQTQLQLHVLAYGVDADPSTMPSPVADGSQDLAFIDIAGQSFLRSSDLRKCTKSTWC